MQRFLLLLKIMFLKKIVIGAGSTVYKGWVSTDKDFLDITSQDNWIKILPFGRLKAVLMEHVLEHLTEEDTKKGLMNIYKYLKNGGYVRVAVPDGFHKDKKYIDEVKPHGTGSGADDHKILYNYELLSKILEECGFKCCLLEYWDEFGTFRFKDWRPADGMIMRSFRYDERNSDGKPNYTSLIIDGYKVN